MSVAVAVAVVLMIVLVVMSLFLFIASGGSFPFNIHPAISFNIVRTATIDQNMYPWRCRQIAINADIHIGRAWQPGEAGKAGRCGKSGLGFIEAQGEGDYNPDATRVAMIPEALIKASARGTTKENPMGAMPVARAGPMPRVASAIAPAAATGGEEAHFQEVFRDFVSTREKCGEPADGLTFDKFVLKLRKNKEQLVVKYNCKTVRFQVYVKEGKAALKATPVKE